MTPAAVLISIIISLTFAASRVQTAELKSEIETMNSNVKKVVELLEIMNIAVPQTIDSSKLNNIRGNTSENQQRFRREFADHPLAYIKDQIHTELRRLKESRLIWLENRDGDLRDTEIDFNVKDVYDKRFISKRGKLNKKLIHTSVSYVTNESHLRQDSNSASFSEKITKTNSVAVWKAKEISGEVKIPLIDGSKIGLKFSRADIATDTKSEETLISAPAQKVSVDPFSKVKTTYRLFSYEDVYNYLIDFEIDSSSRVKVVTSVSTDSFSYTLFGPFKQSEFVNLFDVIGMNPNFVCSIKYNSESEIKLDKLNGKFVLRNFPFEETVKNSELEVVIGRQEKL